MHENTNVPARPYGQTGTKVGDGSSPHSLSHADIGRLNRLPASRRYSPRQAEFSAS